MPSESMTFANGYQAIRVPAKVTAYWTAQGPDQPVLFCGLDDGRVYQSMRVRNGPASDDYARQWVLYTPSMEDR
jgi:hypothetical protein